MERGTLDYSLTCRSCRCTVPPGEQHIAKLSGLFKYHYCVPCGEGREPKPTDTTVRARTKSRKFKIKRSKLK